MSLPSFEDLIPAGMTYASVHDTPDHADLFVVNLDTKEVVDHVVSVDTVEGSAYIYTKDTTLAVEVPGNYQICVISHDCAHGFVVREIKDEYRFLCKECDIRFRAYPRRKRCLLS
jgi:peptide chain release factor 1